MPGETDLHKTLKKEACRWMFRMGYRAIAAEVKMKPLGIIDAVGTGLFRPYQNYLAVGRELAQVCLIECKASRSDFLRDLSHDGQLSLCIAERERNLRQTYRDPRRALNQRVGLGKFDACIAQPMGNIHYVLAPQGIIQKKDLPPRWGLLTLGDGGISVIVKAEWQECARTQYVDGCIARTLTSDIYKADDRAINSVNREIWAQQQELASRIRTIKERMVSVPAAPEDAAAPEPPPLADHPGVIGRVVRR
jgi:hypothetical protein